jgi:hypothetical protein
MFSESMTTNERYAACVRKPLEDIYSYQTTSCVQREKEKEKGEQGVGSGLLVQCRMRLTRLMPRVHLPLGKVPYTICHPPHHFCLAL